MNLDRPSRCTTPSAVPWNDTDATSISRIHRTLVLRPLHVSDGRCDVPQCEVLRLRAKFMLVKHIAQRETHLLDTDKVSFDTFLEP